MKVEQPLNDKTPKWFKDWHNLHYRSFRQEFGFYKKLSWVILVSIIGAAVVGNSNLNVLGKIVQACLGE